MKQFPEDFSTDDPTRDDSIREDELVAHLFGDADDPAAVDAALAASPALRREAEALRATLTMVDRVHENDPVPPRGDDFGAEMWRRLEDRLDMPQDDVQQDEETDETQLETGRVVPFARPLRPTRATWLALAAAALVLLALGFLLGRLGQPDVPGDGPIVAGRDGSDEGAGEGPELSDAGRERLLLAALSSHLGRSERLLTEVANASDASRREVSDAELECLWAAELLASNRLYRRAAEAQGQKRIARLLQELEPVLLELAHADPDRPHDEIDQLRRRLDDQDLLFKVRVTERRLAQPTPRVDSL